jgi:biotin synthase
VLPGGANSIFVGGRLPTTSHPGRDADAALFALLDLRPMALGAEARAA